MVSSHLIINIYNVCCDCCSSFDLCVGLYGLPANGLMITFGMIKDSLLYVCLC